MTGLVTTFIGLGSNLDDPLNQVTRACAGLAKLPHSQLVAVSPWYLSAAVGPGSQPNYINGVAQLATGLAPEQLLDHLQSLEHAQGRQRSIRWGARSLDLDILLYADMQINSHRLVVPHSHLQQRNFVVYPLFDLAPDLLLPDGQPLASIKQSLSSQDLQRLGSVFSL